MSRIYLSPPDTGLADQAAINRAFDGGWIAPLGPEVDAFEAELAAVTDRSHGVALSSGTAALHLALLLLGVGQGDRVLVSSLTFSATASAIRYTGAAPVLVDSTPESWNMDPDLLAQFPTAEDALAAIGVVVWSNYDFEADDRLAAAAVKWVEDVDQVVIVSPDKDMTQVVVGDRIVTYARREQKMYDEAAVMAKFGVRPESIPDYLALVGDSADGLPGLPGWGAKSASAVLARFPRLELIPASSAEWGVAVRGAEKLAATLVAMRDEAYLYRELTTLRLDVPIDEALEDLEWKGVPETDFLAFCDETGLDPESIDVPRWA